MNFSLTSAGELLLRASWQAGILAVIIFVAQWLAASRISARWRYNLWMLVVLRLLLPIVPSTQWSVHNWIALPKKSPQQIPQPMQSVMADLSVVVLDSAPAPIPIQQSPPPVIPKPPPKTWRDYAVPAAWILWLAGFSFFFLRTLIATARLRKQSRHFTSVTDPQTLQILDTARQRMRIRRPIALFSAPNLTTPALMGLIRPKILLPTKVLDDFHPSELRLIFLHELAHLRRRDIAINWLISILNMLHWFNPLLWLAFSRIRAERELACDELVLKSSGSDERREYGNTMIKLLQAFSAGSALPGAVGILEGQAPLRRRITMIAQFERKQSRTWIALLTTIILAMVALTDAAVGQQRGRGQPNPGPRQPTGLPGQQGLPGGGGYGGAGAPPQVAADAPGPRFSNTEQDKNADAANEKTRAALRKTLPEVKFDNVALKDALAFIQDVTELNVYTDWKSLEGAGIPPDVAIGLRLRNVPAGEVLRLMLREISPELRYRIETGIVVISMLVPEPVALIKAYNVEDLTRQNDTQTARSLDVLETRLKAATEDAQRDQFQQMIANVNDSIEQRRGLRMQELVTLIQSTVSPYATAGMAVKSFDNKLIITADEAGHQEVTKVLSMLRDRGEGAGGGANPATPAKPAGGNAP